MSSMMDLASALGGGGGSPYDQGPPDQGPPSAPDDTGGGEQYTTSLDALDGAEEALQAFIRLDPDQGDRAVAAQCLQNILKLKSVNQKAVQSGGDMRSLARALQGQAVG
jgi:hypothetical protein